MNITFVLHVHHMMFTVTYFLYKGIKLGEYEGAEKDCTKVLQLEPTNIKGRVTFLINLSAISFNFV